MGVVDCRRAYYYCAACGVGHCPFDDAVGFNDRRLSPAVQQVCALTGVQAESFAKAAEVLPILSGLRLSESTLERTTEDAGQRLDKAYRDGWTPTLPKKWAWQLDALQRKTAYVQLDATGVGIQGPHGAKRPGRMVYVGAIANPLPNPEAVPVPVAVGPRVPARYVAGLYTLAEMGPLLRQQAHAVGMDEADIWIAISDGGNGLEELLQTNFPRVAAVIIDYWHVCEYLARLAEAAFPNDATQRDQLRREWSRLLKNEGGWVVLNTLRVYRPERRTKHWLQTWATVEQYLTNHGHRMDYPEYLANGWSIGSGVVESACKTVIGHRLKGGARRWSEACAHEVAVLRSLFCSEPGAWTAFWNRHVS
jgi:hypothetical protein